MISSCTNHTERSGRLNSHILLSEKGKFSLGDDLKWAEKAYDDSNWDSISLGKVWEEQGFPEYDGFAWYRLKFFLPASLLKDAFMKDSLKILLGKIDDCDQIFLNGELLGENNRVLTVGTHPDALFRNASHLADLPRRYVVATHDSRLLWDQENTLAIRVYDNRSNRSGGGITSANQSVSLVSMEDDISFNKKDFYKLDSLDQVNRSLIMKNNSSTRYFSGSLSIKGKQTETQQEVIHIQTSVALKPGELFKIPVSLPISTDPIEMVYSFVDENSGLMIQDADIIPFVLIRDH